MKWAYPIGSWLDYWLKAEVIGAIKDLPRLGLSEANEMDTERSFTHCHWPMYMFSE